MLTERTWKITAEIMTSAREGAEVYGVELPAWVREGVRVRIDVAAHTMTDGKNTLSDETVFGVIHRAILYV